MPAVLLVALALSATPADGAGLAAVRAAVESALAVPSSQAEVLDVTGAPPSCAVLRADVPRPVPASGQVAVHVSGRDAAGRACEGWAWARVRVTALALVTTRAVAEGEALEGAVSGVDREVTAGHPILTTLPEGASAARAMTAGTVLERALLRIGPRPGDAVAVVLVSGTLTVEQSGRAVPCRGGRACALLPTGRRVEGTWHAGRIEVDSR